MSSLTGAQVKHLMAEKGQADEEPDDSVALGTFMRRRAGSLAPSVSLVRIRSKRRNSVSATRAKKRWIREEEKKQRKTTPSVVSRPNEPWKLKQKLKRHCIGLPVASSQPLYSNPLGHIPYSVRNRRKTLSPGRACGQKRRWAPLCPRARPSPRPHPSASFLKQTVALAAETMGGLVRLLRLPRASRSLVCHVGRKQYKASQPI